MSAQHGAACTTCQRLRAFVTAGASLILALYLQPDWATALAGHMPDPLWIGVALTLSGPALILWRLRPAWQRARRMKRRRA